MTTPPPFLCWPTAPTHLMRGGLLVRRSAHDGAARLDLQPVSLLAADGAGWADAFAARGPVFTVVPDPVPVAGKRPQTPTSKRAARRMTVGVAPTHDPGRRPDDRARVVAALAWCGVTGTTDLVAPDRTKAWRWGSDSNDHPFGALGPGGRQSPSGTGWLRVDSSQADAWMDCVMEGGVPDRPDAQGLTLMGHAATAVLRVAAGRHSWSVCSHADSDQMAWCWLICGILARAGARMSPEDAAVLQSIGAHRGRLAATTARRRATARTLGWAAGARGALERARDVLAVLSPPRAVVVQQERAALLSAVRPNGSCAEERRARRL